MFVLGALLLSNKKNAAYNLPENSSVNMSKVTQIVSTRLQGGYKCFWLRSQEAIDPGCSVL